MPVTMPRLAQSFGTAEEAHTQLVAAFRAEANELPEAWIIETVDFLAACAIDRHHGREYVYTLTARQESSIAAVLDLIMPVDVYDPVTGSAFELTNQMLLGVLPFFNAYLHSFLHYKDNSQTRIFVLDAIPWKPVA